MFLFHINIIVTLDNKGTKSINLLRVRLNKHLSDIKNAYEQLQKHNFESDQESKDLQNVRH